jgi:hypothetical protein
VVRVAVTHLQARSRKINPTVQMHGPTKFFESYARHVEETHCLVVRPLVRTFIKLLAWPPNTVVVIHQKIKRTFLFFSFLTNLIKLYGN